MAEFPALPLWTDAYLGDTTHLTTIEHGAYLLLLMTAWRTRDCVLPDDNRLLARYARLNAQQWKRMRPIVQAFFTVDNGVWRQGRLTDERGAVERHRQLQIEKGKAGAVAKALKRQGRGKAAASSGLPSADPQGEAQDKLPSPSPSSEDKSSAQSAPDPIKELFDVGVTLMVAGGATDKQARSLIGKWRKARSDAEVLTALLECRRQDISEPIEWLTKRLKSAHYVSPSGYEYRGDVDAVIREAEKRADWGTYWQAKGDREGRPMSASG